MAGDDGDADVPRAHAGVATYGRRFISRDVELSGQREASRGGSESRRG